MIKIYVSKNHNIATAMSSSSHAYSGASVAFNFSNVQLSATALTAWLEAFKCLNQLLHCNLQVTGQNMMWHSLGCSLTFSVIGMRGDKWKVMLIFFQASLRDMIILFQNKLLQAPVQWEESNRSCDQWGPMEYFPNHRILSQAFKINIPIYLIGCLVRWDNILENLSGIILICL